MHISQIFKEDEKHFETCKSIERRPPVSRFADHAVKLEYGSDDVNQSQPKPWPKSHRLWRHCDISSELSVGREPKKPIEHLTQFFDISTEFGFVFRLPCNTDLRTLTSFSLSKSPVSKLTDWNPVWFRYGFPDVEFIIFWNLYKLIFGFEVPNSKQNHTILKTNTN